MIACNEFIENSRGILEQYFDHLVNVDDLQSELVMDKWLERTNKRDMQIQVDRFHRYVITK